MIKHSESALESVRSRITRRCDEVYATDPEWPCGAGCSDCCKSLGALPEATELELEQIRVAIARLPKEARRVIRDRIAALQQGAPPFTCPLLEPTSGRCTIYSVRPTDCRMYGFYADRDGGRWCNTIELRLRESHHQPTMGNHAAVDRQVTAALGPRMPLVEGIRGCLE